MPRYIDNGEFYDIPDDMINNFLRDKPKAVRTKRYTSGKDAWDIPETEEQKFLQEMPNAISADKPYDPNQDPIRKAMDQHHLNAGIVDQFGAIKPNLETYNPNKPKAQAEYRTAPPEFSGQNAKSKSKEWLTRETIEKPDFLMTPDDINARAELKAIESKGAQAKAAQNQANQTQYDTDALAGEHSTINKKLVDLAVQGKNDTPEYSKLLQRSAEIETEFPGAALGMTRDQYDMYQAGRDIIDKHPVLSYGDALAYGTLHFVTSPYLMVNPDSKIADLTKYGDMGVAEGGSTFGNIVRSTIASMPMNVSMMVNPTIAVPLTFTDITSRNIKDYYDAGTLDTGAYMTALASGSVQTAIEYMSDTAQLNSYRNAYRAGGREGLQTLINKDIKNIFLPSWNQAKSTIAKGILTEGGEEVAQNIANRVINHVLNDEAMPQTAEEYKAWGKELAHDFIGGAFGGFVMGGVGTSIQVVANKNIMAHIDYNAPRYESVMYLKQAIQQINQGDFETAATSLQEAKKIGARDNIRDPNIMKGFNLATDAINMSRVQQVMITKTENASLGEDITKMRSEANALIQDGHEPGFETPQATRLYELNDQISMAESQVKKNMRMIHADAELREINEALYQADIIRQKARIDAGKKTAKGKTKQAEDIIAKATAEADNLENDANEALDQLIDKTVNPKTEVAPGFDPATDQGKVMTQVKGATGIETKAVTPQSKEIAMEETTNDSTNQNGIPSPDSGGETPIVVGTDTGTSEGSGGKTPETNAGEQGQSQSETVKGEYYILRRTGRSPIFAMVDHQDEKYYYTTDGKRISKKGKRAGKVDARTWLNERNKSASRTRGSGKSYATKFGDKHIITKKQLKQMPHLWMLWGTTFNTGDYPDLENILVRIKGLKNKPLIKVTKGHVGENWDVLYEKGSMGQSSAISKAIEEADAQYIIDAAIKELDYFFNYGTATPYDLAIEAMEMAEMENMTEDEVADMINDGFEDISDAYQELEDADDMEGAQNLDDTRDGIFENATDFFDSNGNPRFKTQENTTTTDNTEIVPKPRTTGISDRVAEEALTGMFKHHISSITHEGRNMIVKFRDGRTLTLNRISGDFNLIEPSGRRRGIMGRTTSTGTKGNLSVLIDLVDSMNGGNRTLYHESFHTAWKLFLTQDQIDTVIRYYGKKYATELGIDPKNFNISKLTNSQMVAIEEYGADGAENFIGDRADVPPGIRTIWRRFMDRLRNALVKLGMSTQEAKINDIYRKLEQDKLDGKGIGGNEVTVRNKLSPTQIKSATANIGTFDGANPDIRYKMVDDSISMMYSTGLRLLEQKLPKRFSKEVLTNIVNKDLKSDEMLSFMIPEFLDQAGDTINKEDLRKWIFENQLLYDIKTLEDDADFDNTEYKEYTTGIGTNYREYTFRTPKADGYVAPHFRHSGNKNLAMHMRLSDAESVNNYTIPDNSVSMSGTIYPIDTDEDRQVLAHKLINKAFPEAMFEHVAGGMSFAKRMVNEYYLSLSSRTTRQDPLTYVKATIMDDLKRNNLQNNKEYLEFVDKLLAEMGRWTPAEPEVITSYNAPGIIIEEIQSDYHQEGRSKGYLSPKDKKAADALRVEAKDMVAKFGYDSTEEYYMGLRDLDRDIQSLESKLRTTANSIQTAELDIDGTTYNLNFPVDTSYEEANTERNAVSLAIVKKWKNADAYQGIRKVEPYEIVSELITHVVEDKKSENLSIIESMESTYQWLKENRSWMKYKETQAQYESFIAWMNESLNDPKSGMLYTIEATDATKERERINAKIKRLENKLDNQHSIWDTVTGLEDKAYELEQDKVPLLPHSKFHEFLFKLALIESALSGNNDIYWTTGKTQGERWPGDEKRTAGLIGFYDGMMGAYANKLGKKYGTRVDQQKITANGKTVEFNHMALPQAMINDIKEQGMPRYKLAPDYQPEKTIKAYKLFETKKNRHGEIFPLFIGAKEATPIGVWLKADYIPTKGFSPRPGWHLGFLPLAPHLRKTSTGTMKSSRVWYEVEIPADVDWQTKADASPTKDIRGEVPEGGYYSFPRPNVQGGSWKIAGAIKIIRPLSLDEVIKIRQEAGNDDTRYKLTPDDINTRLREAQEMIRRNKKDPIQIAAEIATEKKLDPKQTEEKIGRQIRAAFREGRTSAKDALAAMSILGTEQYIETNKPDGTDKTDFTFHRDEADEYAKEMGLTPEEASSLGTDRYTYYLQGLNMFAYGNALAEELDAKLDIQDANKSKGIIDTALDEEISLLIGTTTTVRLQYENMKGAAGRLLQSAKGEKLARLNSFTRLAQVLAEEQNRDILELAALKSEMADLEILIIEAETALEELLKIVEQTTGQKLKSSGMSAVEEVAIMRANVDELKRRFSGVSRRATEVTEKLKISKKQEEEVIREIKKIKIELTEDDMATLRSLISSGNVDEEQKTILQVILDKQLKPTRASKKTLRPLLYKRGKLTESQANLIRKITGSTFKDIPKIKPTGWDIAKAWFYSSILSSPMTHARNIVGNETNMALENLVNIVAGREFRSTLKSITEMGAGLKESAKAFKDASEYLKKYDLTGAQTGRVMKAATAVTRLLAAEDAYFYRRGYGAQLLSLALVESKRTGTPIQSLIQNPTEAMIIQAQYEAQRATFNYTPEGILGNLVQMIDLGFGLLEQGGGIGKGTSLIIKMKVLPFTRVVANVFNAGLDWTPVGYLGAIKYGTGLVDKQVTIGKNTYRQRDIWKDKNGQPIDSPYRKRDMTRQLTRATLGTIAMALMQMLMKDILSGGGPKDPEKRKQLQETGWQPYSIKIGNRWIPYSMFPISPAMAAIANYNEAIDSTSGKAPMDAATALSYTIMGIANTILDKSFLSNVSTLLNAVARNDKKYLLRWVGETPGTFLSPNVLRMASDIGYRRTHNPETVVQYMMYGLRPWSNPWLRKTVPASVNVYGNEVKRPSVVKGVIGSPIMDDQPLYVYDKNNIPHDIREVANAINTAGSRIGGTNSYEIKLDDKKYITLRGFDKELFLKARGLHVSMYLMDYKEQIMELAESGRRDDLDDLLQKIASKSTREAKKEMIESYENSQLRHEYEIYTKEKE